MTCQEYCLKWENHQNAFQLMFIQLLEGESLCDVTLLCEGKPLRAHRLVVSACSELFQSVLSTHEDKDPLVILADVKFDIMKALLQFMYRGEIKVEHSQLHTLLQTAEQLKISGLAQETWPSFEDQHQISNDSLEHDTVTPPLSPVSTMNLPPSRKRKTKSECGNINKLPKIANIHQNQHNQVVSDDNESEIDVADRLEEDLLDTGLSEHVKVEFTDDDDDDNDDGECEVDPEDSASFSQPITAKTDPRVLNQLIDLSDHIKQGGDRNNFWDIPSTKTVLESIRNKEIEMKRAAELLGVPYGTLYGRYRFAYGSLKISRKFNEFMLEPESREIIKKFQKKEISLHKCAEMLDVNVAYLAKFFMSFNN